MNNVLFLKASLNKRMVCNMENISVFFEIAKHDVVDFDIFSEKNKVHLE